VSDMLWGRLEQSDRISRRGINLQNSAALCMHHLCMLIERFPGREYLAGILSLRWFT